MMNLDELCAWLRANSSGIYRPSAEAADEIERLRAEVEALRTHMRFVERWANHHGGKPGVTAAEVLGVIQHYPPIVEITRSYRDGLVPKTPDPWSEVESLRKDANRWQWLRQAAAEHAGTLDKVVDEAMAAMKEPK